jgi:hypothetical protein
VNDDLKRLSILPDDLTDEEVENFCRALLCAAKSLDQLARGEFVDLLPPDYQPPPVDYKEMNSDKWGGIRW